MTPDGPAVPASVFGARTCQILARQHIDPGELPGDVTALEQAPGAGRQAVLAAVDRQLATLERCPEDRATTRC